MITYYLKAKIQELNTCVEYTLTMGQSYANRNVFISSIIHEFNRIYIEISDYNRQYWCKYLGAIWAIIGAIVAFITYVVTLADAHDMFVKCFLSVYFVVNWSSLIFIIQTSDSIYNAVGNTHKLLNSYLCDKYLMPLSLRFKVCYIQDNKKRIGLF